MRFLKILCVFIDCAYCTFYDILLSNLLHKRVIVIGTILIADKSEAFAQALAKVLCPYCEVHICHSGDTVLELLNEIRPDGLVLDLCLPYMTGLEILEAATYRPPVILGTTNVVTDSIVEAATAAGIKQLFLRPCKAKVVASYLLETLNEKERAAP